MQLKRNVLTGRKIGASAQLDIMVGKKMVVLPSQAQAPSLITWL